MSHFLVNRVLYWLLRVFLRSLVGATAGLYTFWVMLTMPDRYGGVYARMDAYPPEYYWIPGSVALLVILFPGQIMGIVASLFHDGTSSMSAQKNTRTRMVPVSPQTSRGKRTA